MDFKKDIKIDPLDLVAEWEHQPEMFHDYKVEHAKAVRERDILISQIDRKAREIEILRAETDLKIRENPSNYGIEKITENTIHATVLSQETVKKAYEQYFDMKEKLAGLDYEVNALDSAYWAFVQRKTALEKITALYLSEYYATKMGIGKESEAFEEQYEGLKRTLKRKGE